MATMATFLQTISSQRQVTNVMATADLPGWYHGTTPKVVDRIHAALHAAGTERYWCSDKLTEACVELANQIYV